MKVICIVSLLSILVLSVTGVDLRGKWKEDQYKRQGLNDFLYEMGKKYGVDILTKIEKRNHYSIWLKAYKT